MTFLNLHLKLIENTILVYKCPCFRSLVYKECFLFQCVKRAQEVLLLRHGAYKIIWLFENYLVLTKMIRMLLWVVAYMVCKLLLLCAPSGRLGKLKRLSFASWHGKNIKACAEAGKYQSITSVSCAFCVSFFVVICVKKV